MSLLITDNEDKIRFALSCMHGPAAAWKEDYMSSRIQQGEFIPGKWKEFLQMLETSYNPSNNQRDAEDQLRNLRQGGRIIDHYIADFANLANRASITDDAALVSYFRDGLDHPIRIEAVRRNPANTIKAWKEAARQASEVINELKRIARGRQNISSILYRQQPRTQPTYHHQTQKRPQQLLQRHRYVPPLPRIYPPGAGRGKTEYDMEVDNIEHIINNLEIEDLRSAEEDYHGEYQYEEFYDDPQENYDIYETQEISGSGDADGSQNPSSSPDPVSHVINLILSDKQKQQFKARQCFECSKPGHWARNCPNRKNKPVSYNNIPRNSAYRNRKTTFNRRQPPPQRKPNQNRNQTILNIEEDVNEYPEMEQELEYFRY